jgi:hypothetical protein
MAAPRQTAQNDDRSPRQEPDTLETQVPLRRISREGRDQQSSRSAISIPEASQPTDYVLLSDPAEIYKPSRHIFQFCASRLV